MIIRARGWSKEEKEKEGEQGATLAHFASLCAARGRGG